MIAIDFVPGTHGRFLEYICNRFLSDMPAIYTQQLPFDESGASHNTAPEYWQNRVFQASHFYQEPDVDLSGLDFISIDYTAADLLAITQICFLRAGNLNIDTDLLHLDTYNKLNNARYRSVLDNLISTFGKNLKVSYDAIKDPSWPEIDNLRDYYSLPPHILAECQQQHGLKIFELCAEQPDCPRWCLREFFKLGFRDPAQNGLMMLQSSRIRRDINRHFSWQFPSFYRWFDFLIEITRLSKWLSRDIQDIDSLYMVYNKFVDQQPYAESRDRCDSIVLAVKEGDTKSCSGLTLVEQAYVDAQLELQFGREMPTDRVEYFATTQEIKEYIDHGR